MTPFIPFDAISYGAGFVKLKKRDFMLGTIVGLVPRISFYLLIGSEVVDLVEEDLTLGLIVFVVIIIVLFSFMFIIERILTKMQNNVEKQDIQSIPSSGNTDRINDKNSRSGRKNL